MCLTSRIEGLEGSTLALTVSDWNLLYHINDCPTFVYFS